MDDEKLESVCLVGKDFTSVWENSFLGSAIIIAPRLAVTCLHVGIDHNHEFRGDWIEDHRGRRFSVDARSAGKLDGRMGNIQTIYDVRVLTSQTKFTIPPLSIAVIPGKFKEYPIPPDSLYSYGFANSQPKRQGPALHAPRINWPTDENFDFIGLDFHIREGMSGGALVAHRHGTPLGFGMNLEGGFETDFARCISSNALLLLLASQGFWPSQVEFVYPPGLLPNEKIAQAQVFCARVLGMPDVISKLTVSCAPPLHDFSITTMALLPIASLSGADESETPPRPVAIGISHCSQNGCSIAEINEFLRALRQQNRAFRLPSLREVVSLFDLLKTDLPGMSDLARQAIPGPNTFEFVTAVEGGPIAYRIDAHGGMTSAGPSGLRHKNARFRLVYDPLDPETQPYDQ
ncbi:MAG: hypothetical protein ACPGOY_13420 [Rhodospirillaceae bacterium]